MFDAIREGRDDKKRPPKVMPCRFSQEVIGVWASTVRPHSDEAQILSALGQQLRERYEPVVKEPLPDRLGALVAQLERVAEDSETR